jgi:Rod binding domain-containing protein
MAASLDIQNAMTMARAAPVQAPHAGASPAATKKAAKEFESVFIAQFLGSMFEGIKTDGMFGGGEGEEMFRSLMLDQYGKKIADQGGFGLADSITRSLVQRQQAKQTEASLADAKAKGEQPSAPLPTAKTAPVFAAHPATAFTASAAASALKSTKP